MISSFVMMWLGAFRFGASRPSHDKIRQTSTYRWEPVDLVGRRPQLHFLGPGEETMALEGTIHPHFRGGLRQVEAMRAQAALGLPMLMGDGLGFVLGHWVIAGVEDQRSYLMADGAPRQIDFTLNLVRAPGLLG
ncbi:tail assembly protein [Jannaschia pagri]|uniref:Tail assembly protein n=1 Tax=Jannaschia pagri TaxID=2829797 RepID=A0ABQ4NPB4_9RHOB|nr:MULTISPECIES: phage tail protein [unclassified Jannaschia]GIT92407.1 tail assembly protein [Jannaschia sp. AI_61]GIT96242.1 tail assembly protein [Jannaschia sp. AI_62]